MIEFSWIVIKWKSLWKTIWFPTANIEYNSKKLEDGTYKINGVIDNEIVSWAWVYLKEKNLFEAHFFDLDKNLYWKKIEIIVLEKIRENKKFSSIEELKKQIELDIEKIKSKISYVVTFWTFDIFHPWHEYYLNSAKKYGDKLITIIARDKNVAKLKNIKCKNDENTRSSIVNDSNIPDLVVLWELEDPLKVIKEYNPRVVCLWYDQKWFSDILEKYIEENNKNIKIVRIKPFKQEIFKSSILKKNN